MKEINFEQYPKVLTYVQGLIGQSYFRAGNNPLDEQTFITIVESWIDKYEHDIDTMVKNTFYLYELTSGECGYQCLSTDWLRRKEVFKTKNTISVAQIRESWQEKFIACISHLYQGYSNAQDGFHTITGGASGCMITCDFTVQFLDSDLKAVKYNVVSDFNMSLQIENSLHG